MTSQGSPISVLRRAIRGGNLRAVDLALIDVQQLDLEDALDVLVLMATADDPRCARWAARWAQRLEAAHADQLVALLDRLPDPGAAEVLRRKAAELRHAEPSARMHLRR